MAGDEYRKANYKPTLNQKLKIQQAKDALQSWQGNILSNQKLWQQAYDVIQKDKMKGDYDEKHFWDKTNEFYDSGILPTDLLAPKPYENVAGELAMKKYAGKIAKNITTYDKNGNAYTHEDEVVADEDERKNLMAEDMHKDVRLAASAMKEFSELPMETKKKYLDDAEENKKNAIINWWHDKYKEYYAPKLSMNKVAPVKGGDVNQPLKLSTGQPLYTRQVNRIEPVTVGDATVTKDNFDELVRNKANLTENQKKAVEQFSKNKRMYGNAKKTTVQPLPIYGRKQVPYGISITASAKNEFDPETGERLDPKYATGQTQYNHIDIQYMPYSQKLQKIGDEEESGGLNNLKPGWEVRAFLIGDDKDAEGKNKEHISLLNNEHVDAIEYQSNLAKQKFDKSDLFDNNGNIRTLGTRAKKATSTSNLKELKVTNAQVIEAAKKANLSVEEYKNRLKKLGHKLIITK
jgi:hypothetical protein